MTPEDLRTQAHSALSDLEALAERLSDATFVADVGGRDWTFGQVFDHIIRSCLDVHLPYAEACIRGEGGPGRKRLATALLFRLGRFPRIRLNPTRAVKSAMPNGWEPRTLSRSDALAGVHAVRKRVDLVCDALPNANLALKQCYPPLGFLNAREWAQMIPMHIRHHLEVQLARRPYSRHAVA